MSSDPNSNRKGFKSLLRKFKSTDLGSSDSTDKTSKSSTSPVSRSISQSSITSSTSSIRSIGTSNYGKKVETLGSGISGTVELFYKKSTNEYFAIKTFKPREKFQNKQEYKNQCYQEFEVVNGLKGTQKNIIKTYGFISGMLSHQIVMEYQPYSLLKAVQIARPEPDEILCFFRQICEGVKFLHSNFIAHRDLKMENLVLDPTGVVKIIDFGTCFNFTKERKKATGIVGTESLISPESLRSLQYDSETNDVWSLGILLYSMLNWDFPWKSARESDVNFKRFREDRSVLKDKYPEEVWGIVLQILEIDSTKRISINDLVHELSQICCEHSLCPDSRHARTLRLCAKRFKIESRTL